jgi:hypothetical protein
MREAMTRDVAWTVEDCDRHASQRADRLLQLKSITGLAAGLLVKPELFARSGRPNHRSPESW